MTSLLKVEFQVLYPVLIPPYFLFFLFFFFCLLSFLHTYLLFDSWSIPILQVFMRNPIYCWSMCLCLMMTSQIILQCFNGGFGSLCLYLFFSFSFQILCCLTFLSYVVHILLSMGNFYFYYYYSCCQTIRFYLPYFSLGEIL